MLLLSFMCIDTFMLPVKCLKEPSKEMLIRDCNKVHVQNLKHEILKNPCSSVNPILCVVNLDEGCRFNKDQKESYSYMTISGNHSRQAFQEILDEQATLRQNKAYTYRLCSVYTSMEKPLLNRLAFKNNRAAAFCHKMTTWDWVS